MAKQVSMGAGLQCSFGASPCSLGVAPGRPALNGGPPAATILDHQPLVHVPSFGLCRSPANPAVATATAAASGVLTPMPCIPATPAPWTPGRSGVQIAGQPALSDDSSCQCIWGGRISITSPGASGTELG